MECIDGAAEFGGDAGRELRFTGTNPEYVLRGLLRCGRSDEAMCPGSTTKKSGKTYRFYRCSTRDKFGKDRCAARPLPARALDHLKMHGAVDLDAVPQLGAARRARYGDDLRRLCAPTSSSPTPAAARVAATVARMAGDSAGRERLVRNEPRSLGRSPSAS